MFSFKSYSWVIGSTSFRVKEINYKIEQQLKTLKEMFDKYPNSTWRETQETYYDMLHEKGLLKGDAKRKDKDARQKTSGLKELGLVTKDRRITKVGESLLNIIDSEETYVGNNFLIEEDAMLYLKQLLKVHVHDSDFNIKPFIALLYFIDKLEYITVEEFTYLLPICKNPQEVKEMVDEIKSFRNSSKPTPINRIILNKIYRMDNYKQALSYFLNRKDVNEEDVCNIGLNRKSAIYDKPYYDLYIALWNCMENKRQNTLSDKDILIVLEKVKKLSGKAKNEWNNYLFGSENSTPKKIKFFKERILLIFGGKDKKVCEEQFRKIFFNALHVFKWRVNLEEYADLNERYFALSDILIFKNGKIELSLFAKYYFRLCIDDLLEDNIEKDSLEKNLTMPEISKYLDVNVNEVINLVNEETGKTLDIPSMKNYFKNEKIRQFDELIKSRFSKDKLIELFELIEEREDEKVQKYVTDNADVPTIFEYLLGITWYIISNQEFDLLESWNLSLDANMLPKRHAGGGEADIIIQYSKSKVYEKHKLMLEATLTNNTNQRRAEMEPVSRHLGRLKADNPNEEIYGVFVANHLDKNVVIDFRSRKFVPFYDNKSGKYITNNKIIPLGTQELRKIIKENMNYSKLYKIFEGAYDSDIEYEKWYEKEIKRKL